MMIKFTKHLGMLMMLAVTFCTGCATKYSNMVRFLPAERAGIGATGDMFLAINQALPFEICRGDFVVNGSEDGQTCWVAFGDRDKTAQLVGFLKSSPEWKYTSTSSVRTSARGNFGLSPRAAKYNGDGTVRRLDEFASARVARTMKVF